VPEPDHRFGPFSPRHSPVRARLREATIALVLERGLDDVADQALCARAEFDPADFERDFGSVRNCALQVYLANIDEFDRLVFGAVEATEGWPLRLRVAAYAALGYVAARPLEARFNFIAMLEAGEEAQAHRDRYVQRIVALIDEGRGGSEALGPEVAQGVFGAVYEFLLRKVRRDADIPTIDRYVPELMYMAVRPYLGEEAARAELTLPAPSRSSSRQEI